VNIPDQNPLDSAPDAFFYGLNDQLTDRGWVVTKFDTLAQWARTGSMMWLQFELACCGVEMMQFAMPRYDAERFLALFLVGRRAKRR